MKTLRERFVRRLRELMDTDLNANTQVKVATKAGVAQATVQRILSDQQVPTLDVMEKIAAAFNISMPECFLLEAEEIELLKAWRQLADKEKSLALGYISVAAQTSASQLSLDAARPVPAQLQALQKASAGRPAPSEVSIKDASHRKKRRGT